MSKKQNDSSDYISIGIGDIDLSDIDLTSISETITINDAAVDSYTYSYYGTDQTPSDPVEEAELKLRGICPSCRQSLSAHDWSCKHNTFNNNGNFSLSFDNTAPSITVGTATIDEEKIRKIDKLLEVFGDHDLDDLIQKLDKIKDIT